MTFRVRWLVAVVLPWTVLAQTPRRTPDHRVSGIVYDSTAGVPLAGAIVQAVLLDSTRTPISGGSTQGSFTALTDSAGHYALTGLPAGTFALGFQHEALNALGLESPVRLMVLAADTEVVEDLSIPSGPAVRARACPPPANAGDGLLVGYIAVARTGGPLPTAAVVVRWTELALRRGKLQSVQQQTPAVVDASGRYRACGIPDEGPISMQVAVAGFYAIELELTVPPGGVLRRDLRLAEVGAGVAGSAIKIRIVDDSGTVVNGGRAAVDVLGREAPIEQGEASLTDVPAGTWVVSVRALGYQPRVVILDAPTSIPEPTITLSRGAQVLDTVMVTSKRAQRDSGVLRDIEARLLVANGTLIRADNPSVLSSVEASDAIRVANGFLWKGPTTVEARQDVKSPCRTTHPDTVLKPGAKEVAVYLDGQRVPGGLEMVNRMVPPKDILAIEAYPDVLSAPFLWRTNNTCAVVAFWTKH